MRRAPYLLFFASGISGLIYQVLWVRQFGAVFGNTVYSASLVTTVFMLGLGVGSAVLGRAADRRFAADPRWPLRAYGLSELGIAALALGATLALTALDKLAAASARYAV